MKDRLPNSYKTRMQALLGDAYDAFEQSLERPVYNGMRVNTLKIDREAFTKLWKDPLDPVAWCPEGLYYTEGQPSRHPYYYAGLYYLQEPSAMAPAAVLPVEPGDRVLDLCAAPGGKSTQLLCKLKGKGVLVSNDVSPSRAKALLKNLELFGGRNFCVTTETPYKLAQRFPHFFTKILVDAPCSGEGMFHKEPAIIKNWEQYGNAYYAALQEEILEQAALMLAPGGKMVYSTCTFAPMEDEQSIQNFLSRHPDFRLETLSSFDGADFGHPEWIEGGDPSLRKALRLWPHRVRGEGHFVALLAKEDDSAAQERKPAGFKNRTKDADKEKFFFDWCDQHLRVPLEKILPEESTLTQIGDFLVADPLPGGVTDGLRVLRSGLLLGEIKKDRFEPSQAWAMALSPEQVQNRRLFSCEDPEVIRYLKGETLSGDFERDWILIGVDGFSLGWGKGSGNLLKNKYLKGWRYL